MLDLVNEQYSSLFYVIVNDDPKNFIILVSVDNVITLFSVVSYKFS